MASSVNAQVDKEMCTFGGATHVDNLDAYYKLLRGMLLTPGWRVTRVPVAENAAKTRARRRTERGDG